MSIRTRCPRCRHDYLLADTQAGKMVRCRKCDELFAVRADEPDVQAVPSARRSRPSRPPRPDRRSSALGVVLIVAGSALVLLFFVALVGGGLLLWFRMHNLEANNEKPIVVDNGHMVIDDNAPQKEVEPPDEPATQPTVAAPGDLPSASADPANPLGVKVVDPPSGDEPKTASASELPGSVLRKVKHDTLYLRVTLPDGDVAQGSGFFAVYPGVIVTNAHVVGMLAAGSQKPKEIEATQNSGLPDEKKYKATLLAVDRGSDLAVLRAHTPTVPPPLEVHSSHELQETQKLYVFGFPFGDMLGKSVTVSTTAVSSFRYENGVLHRVQVNGGMSPGNSGGPVVDGRGNVVGVSVAIIPNSQVNFAVPGDNVRSLFVGRLAGKVELDEPYYADGGATQVPVKLRLIDPLNRVRGAAVEVWTGDPGPNRPAGDKPPVAQPGDSTHRRVSLTLKQGEAHGEAPLPELPKGKVYWVQPSWTHGAGESHWDVAVAVPLNLPAVQRQPARLVFHREAGDHSLKLTVKNAYNQGNSDDERAGFWVVDLAANIHEKVSDPSDQGANVQLEYKNLKLGLSQAGHDVEVTDHFRDAVTQMSKATGKVRLDGQGNLVGAADLDVGTIPGPSRRGVVQLGTDMQNALELLVVPLPNKEVQVGDTWKARRSMSFVYAPIHFESSNAWMTFTYLGRRTRAGRDEAVVGLSGRVRPRQAAALKMGGRVHGLAAIDLATGQVSQGTLSVQVEQEINVLGHSSEATATVEVGMQRVQ